eukprot:6702263-Lingulodinium_polyedra.AAC.1
MDDEVTATLGEAGFRVVRARNRQPPAIPGQRTLHQLRCPIIVTRPGKSRTRVRAKSTAPP